VQLELGGIGASRVKACRCPRPRRRRHGRDGECGGDERGGEHEEELAEDQVHAGDGAGKYGFHRAAFLFARGQVHGGIHASGEAEKDYHVADDAAEGRAADLSGGATLCSLNFKRFESRFGEVLGGEVVVNDAVAVFFKALLDVAGGDGGLHIAS